MTRVLLIEDNDRDARLVRIALSEITTDRVEMEHALSLEDGLEKIASADVVLLDLNLPGTTGMETLEQFMATDPKVPVIVLTGLEDEETGLEALRQGAQDYLVKGQMFGVLLGRSVRYAIERHRILQELQK